MTNYQWYMTKDREELINKAKALPDCSDKDLSELLELALSEYVKNHGKGNPAFSLDQFKDEGFKAFPTLGADPDRYFQGKDAVEVGEVRARLEVWRSAVIRRTPAPVDTEEVEPCPYGCGPVPKFSLKSHMWSHHKEQALKDGRLGEEWRDLVDTRTLF